MIRKEGFSLIEFSIVLVIIALITAAITSGSVIREQAELRSLQSDFQNYRLAYQSFVQQYRQVPGDMANAAAVWPAANLCSLSVTCNGNGNGIVEAIWQDSSDETARAWKHLDLAGLIGTGISPIPNGYLGVITIGDMTPSSRIIGTGYYIAGGSDIGGDAAATVLASPWTDNRTNAVFLGKKSSSATSNGLTVGALNSYKASVLDTKYDDGKVDSSGLKVGFSTGKLRVREDQSGGSNCISGGQYTTSDVDACIVGYQLNDIDR